MIASPFYKLIYFDEFSATPKYQQLANSIIKAIEDGKLQVDDMLPSINELSFQFEICRDTAEKGYKYLKNQGIIGSVPGKGYFIKNVDVNRTIKIFLIVNKLSPHKKIIYDSLVETLGDKAAVDFYIYNNDLALFRKLLENSKTDYHYYVVLPHFIEGGDTAHKIINTLPKERLILLDKIIPGVTGNFGAVYENFEKDIFDSLEQALPHLAKYHTIKLIFPENSYYPDEIVHGFISFCQEYTFNYKVVHDITDEPINAGEVFINLMDNDLVVLIERLVESHFEVGKDVGVISYNETPLKKIILNGITTISTDFEAMGVETARIILENQLRHVHVPFSLTLRSSL
ncbi:GntR family transcriptional regulator [Flavisolibacter ginsenosidimutans]|uniref:GntR family transcriptional regulator n=1 Tax=Flavisolibacter ginsenosidimutans TaxID=661481 RepID=A0A5B8UFR7_9BACT|nr:GntR family transcriptional regulator [Flavisolibacter ginsenosidimutans]QEC55424.1 GntR family transcriptional regulator [Flavisolibacter ginsenosidimutans]